MDFSPEQRSALGARMKAARQAHGWTRQEFCDRLGTDSRDQAWSPQRIMNYENGDRVPKDLADLWLLEEGLRLDPGRLSRHLGFLPIGADCPEYDVEDALSADPRLDPDDRHALLTAYWETLS